MSVYLKLTAKELNLVTKALNHMSHVTPEFSKLNKKIHKQHTDGIPLKLYAVLCDTDEGNTVDIYLTKAEQLAQYHDLYEGYSNDDDLYDNTGNVVDNQDVEVVL